MVYGMEDFSHMGTTIPTQDALEAYKLTGSEVANYNNDIDIFRAARIQSALDQFVETETWDADMDMHTAVDSFVEASVAVMEVVRVAEVAETAQTTMETDEAAGLELQSNLQEYVQSNSVELTETEVTDYNESLDMVEEAVATFTAYLVVNSSSDIKSSLQESMNAAESFADATSEINFSYTDSGAQVAFTFATAQAGVTETFNIDVSAYLSSINNQEFFDAGEQSYASNAVNDSTCFGNLQAAIGTCNPRAGNFGMGPPPNVLLYQDDGNGTFRVFAVSDENGNVYEFQAGDDVVNPETGETIGSFGQDGLTCYAGFEGYCTV